MIKSCSKQEFKITRYFHIFSIIVIIAGTSYNIYAAANDKETGLWLPLALAIMITLRLPNQICVAHSEKDGWLSVFGSTIGLISYIILCILIIHLQNKKGVKGQTPPQGGSGVSQVEESTTEKKPKNIKTNTQTLLNLSSFL